MGLFAIGDLHFSFAAPKPMDIFGEQWKEHDKRIIENWKNTVGPEDTVLIPGDISWGMRLADAAADLDVIDGLPGRKVLLPGNHDYWWKSSSRLAGQYPRMTFLKNDTTRWENWFLCGARGWTCPNETAFTAEDEKIYRRELIRLRLSLDCAMRQGAENILVMLHFPPVNENHGPSGFTELFGQYPVREVVYGHLHGESSHSMALEGEREGIRYHLTSSDYLEFRPKRIF
ncbi:metallophosphoesterase [Anaerotignum lactatifermentans]|uniref:Metallophosphoesterase n=1 Tax=Anaerotignum lactatifermentans TaxID=160404 RepID=A0ABS2GE17_9FIRM|nr:metallophosphoesterase [Anaerotignum lactatifermentans]MBM6830337.1 metallophosphoesterase [Anaerotignum lactatifermentans]MBM6878862.1 metallophosphoesterase [Anaerotignum lactatifermentans]MBM6951898.1 metallophosphoesterase [Anaerotignum lactatifermentans]